MKKNYAISPQIISTMEMNNEPLGITNSSSNFIYSNAAKKKFIHNFKKLFDYEGFYDLTLP
ncbi:hypothetical protein PH242_19350 [Photorhabdus bodei]|uniref:hypothetical protein n=1 Tax=Photorhabdus bodei TaxID=2029681 RepID=UPI00232B8523|nr:hypothetical protein [Photorhabdus bodei]MDB6369746.1 hypothetical protein [Photorhabdus bodei]